MDYGTDALDDSPTKNKYYDAFSMNEGSYPLLGINNYDPMEVVLDYNYFFQGEDVGKLYFNIWQGSDTDT